MRVVPHWEATFPLRFHTSSQSQSWALFSPCEKYRYRLRREWGEGKSLVFVMLNPSTADEMKNDPTVERCERRARQLDYGAFEVVNIFAYRATNPRALYEIEDPIGDQNDLAIDEAIKANDDTLIAWGAHGIFRDRGAEVRARLSGKSVYHLGLTQAGEPRHPLYISYQHRPDLLEL